MHKQDLTQHKLCSLQIKKLNLIHLDITSLN